MVARRKPAAQAAAQSEEPVVEKKVEESEQMAENSTEQVNGEEQKAEEAELVVENGVTTNAVNESHEETGEEATVSQLNGTQDDSKVEGDKAIERNFDNDSAAVVQHLSQLRLSIGPLTLEQIHDKDLLPIMNVCSGYQIHTPRVLNMEEGAVKYAMLDIEFKTAEDAKENKELLQKHFESCEDVKIDNWPENKIYYNDYSYLKIDDKIVSRMKEGVLIAGYSKLRDRWLVAINVEPEVTIEKIKELVGESAVDVFRRDAKKKVYVRFDTKEAAKATIDKTITFNGKSMKFKELLHHPTEKKFTKNYNTNFNRGNYRGQGRGNMQNFAPQQMPMPYNAPYPPQPYPQQPPQYGYYGSPYGAAPKRMDGYYSNPPNHPPYYGAGSPQFQQKRPRY